MVVARSSTVEPHSQRNHHQGEMERRQPSHSKLHFWSFSLALHHHSASLEPSHTEHCPTSPLLCEDGLLTTRIAFFASGTLFIPGTVVSLQKKQVFPPAPQSRS